MNSGPREALQGLDAEGEEFLRGLIEVLDSKRQVMNTGPGAKYCAIYTLDGPLETEHFDPDPRDLEDTSLEVGLGVSPPLGFHAEQLLEGQGDNAQVLHDDADMVETNGHERTHFLTFLRI